MAEWESKTITEPQPVLLATFNVYDEGRLMRFCHVDDAYGALNEIAVYLRAITKYEYGTPVKDAAHMREIVKERFWEICKEYKIDPMVD